MKVLQGSITLFSRDLSCQNRRSTSPTGPGKCRDMLLGMSAEEERRWYLYDTTASLIFGKKIGFIDEGRDVDGLLDAFRGSVWFLGLMAMFPYLLHPIIKLPIIKNFALPHSGDKRGVGKIMKVSVQESIEARILNSGQHRDRLVEQSKTNNRQSLLKS